MAPKIPGGKPTEYQQSVHGLLEAMRDVADVFRALSSLVGVYIDNETKNTVTMLKGYAQRIAQAVAEGKKPEEGSISKTIRLALKVRVTLEDLFEQAMDEAEDRFDAIVASLKEKAPTLIGENEEREIAELRKRHADLVLSVENVEFEELAEAYNVMVRYLGRLENEVKRMAAEAKEAEKRQKQIASAKELLEELADLDSI